MQHIKYSRKFLKELAKLPNNYSNKIEEFVFETLPNCKTIQQVGKVEKITGYKNYFKVRFGNYRVGIKRNDNDILIATVKHRSEIYKFFP